MEGMNGFDVAKTLKSSTVTRLIPIIMLTGLDDRTARLKGLYAGAEEFLTKPVDRVELIARVRNLLRIKLYGDLLTDQNRHLEHQVRQRTVQLRESQLGLILALGRAAEYRDDDSGNHVRRIGQFTRILAQHLGMEKAFVESIAAASPLHDVGKIGIPDAILLKPGMLTVDEWQVMQTHTVIGATILGESNWPLIRLGREIALSHHERWDGGGYPHGTKGDTIPLAARITNICDQYDTLRSPRAYRAARDHREAVYVITKGDQRTRPEHFDPQVLEAFEAHAEQFRELFEQYSD
ncbi:MAG TPA: two-component system response regulator [Syntrophobacteraceae bacterium]|nr:two-component system response regulator [Syntrophobacteraceae bacterium]